MLRSFAPEVTAIFDAMEIPLKVVETPELGKHVLAKKQLPAGFDLFEEIPVASWPMDNIVNLHVPYCWWCLKIVVQDALEGGLWCSADCKAAAQIGYEILSADNAEASLYAFHDRELQRQQAKSSPTPSESDGGATPSMPISVVSVARCVASIATRLVSIVGRQSLTAEDLESPGITAQVFAAATKSFNRFVEPPADSQFDEIDVKEWSAAVRSALALPMKLTLSKHLGSEKVAAEVSDGILADATLVTIIGQLSLNAQALNTVVSSLPNGKGPAAICFGGAIFALQSNLNHSCSPNAVVSMTEAKNHEIVVRTIREIEEGEEVTISYIPVDSKSTVGERHAALRPYFFECKCKRCVQESSGK